MYYSWVGLVEPEFATGFSEKEKVWGEQEAIFLKTEVFTGLSFAMPLKDL